MGCGCRLRPGAPFYNPNSPNHWILVAWHVTDLLPGKPLPPQGFPSPALTFLHPTGALVPETLLLRSVQGWKVLKI